MTKSQLPIIAISLTLAACGSSTSTTAESDNSPATPVEQLRQRLAETARSGHVIFGHHDDPVYGHNWVGDTGRSDVLETAGDYPGMMSWDLGRLELGDTANLDGVSFERMRNEVIAQDARGGINTFSWHLFNPVNGHDSWDISDTTIVSRMVGDPEVKARFGEQLDRLAAFFNSLTDSAGQRIPVIFRPWHEHTGSWFFWGEKLCTPQEYKQLWHITREHFDSLGVDNVLWAYSPDRLKSLEQFAERYPGDEYVDIVGTDVYHFGGADGVARYRDDATRSLTLVAEWAQTHDKIAAFTETGLESVTMPDWYTGVLLPILREAPVSYVVVWRNAHDKPQHFYAPWPGHEAADDFAAFRADTLTVFASDMCR